MVVSSLNKNRCAVVPAETLRKVHVLSTTLGLVEDILNIYGVKATNIRTD
jgi:hypothetical protein